MSMTPAIQTCRLTRYFGNKPVVHDLDFELQTGKVTALLGLNGAGKTTTIRMMMGLLSPTRGSCRTLGRESDELRPEDLARIGYMIEGHTLYGWMRVSEVGRFAASGHSAWDARQYESIIRHFGIELSDKVGSLSRGQRAGVSLAATLSAQPELMILDDPALGLDPVSRRALNETLVEYAAAGNRTVLMSSHLIDDVERVSDRVAVMCEGRLVVDTTLDDFRDRVSRWSLRFDGGGDDVLVQRNGVAAIGGLIEARQIYDRLILSIADQDDESLAALNRLGADEMESLPTSLDEAVLAYLSRTRSDRSFFQLTNA